jgi:hypothetical protein
MLVLSLPEIVNEVLVFEKDGTVFFKTSKPSEVEITLVLQLLSPHSL